jgi:hypothetical protein
MTRMPADASPVRRASHSRSPRRFAHAGSAWLLLAAAALLPGLAAADPRRFPVDDSASQVLQPVLPMQWEQLVPGPGASNQVSAETVVLVRLDLRAWAGQRARIVMTLPMTRFGALTARWTTQGRLLPGELAAGGETTVFDGLVPADGRLEDTLRLRLSTDGRRLERNESLQFGFELEPGDSP